MNIDERIARAAGLFSKSGNAGLLGVSRWAAECLQADQEGSATIAGLYRSYGAWCLGHGVGVGSKKGLAMWLEQKGYERARGSGGVRLYRGVLIKST